MILDLWKKYNYKDYGIIGEPYFDVDFNKVLYITDTGRRWDGNKVSVRDKVQTSLNYSFHSTDDIIEALNDLSLPNQIMFNFHPQRWHNNIFYWLYEFVIQNSKNLIKRIIFVKNQ